MLFMPKTKLVILMDLLRDQNRLQNNIQLGQSAIPCIFNALSRDLHDSMVYANITRELWLDLEECFSQVNVARIT